MAEPGRAGRRGGGRDGAAARPAEGIDTLAFYLAFVPYLDLQGPVSVTEAAAHFGYAPAFIRDSVASIMTMGVPGDAGLYLPNDLFDFDLDALERRDELVLIQRIAIDDVPRMSAREAAALLAGLALLADDPALHDSADLASLRRKLASGAADAPEEPVVAGSAAASPNFAELREAIASGRRVAFDYRRGDGTTERREVDPLRLESADAVHYLRGWCWLRGDLRTFRLDRIAAIELLTAPVEHELAELDATAAGYVPAPDDPTVTIECDASAVVLMSGYRPRSVRRLPTAERVQLEVAIGSDGALRRILGEVPGAVVVAPAAARAAVRAWAADARHRYASRGM